MDTNGVMKKYKIKIKNPVMGVPITFLDKYCPTQFEIVGMAEDNGKGQSYDAKWDGLNPHCVINGKNMYKRIFIRRKKAEPIVEAK